ncbi:TIGR00266 family protein [bacterium]|nr:TIGR00266 family protein [bacterium]
MRYEIIGDNLQFVKIFLTPGEEVYAEAGKMMFKTPNILMESKLLGKSGMEKLTGVLKRTITGESLFTTHFKSLEGEGIVAFAGNYPGRIEAITLSPGKSFIAQRDAFVCAEISVEFSIAFQKHVGVALFGGEGFILEKFTGPGTVFIHGGGDFYITDLKEEETLHIDTGCIVGFDETVSYEIEFVKDIKTALFGGEGIFLATLRGPGRVILQSLTLARLRREIGGRVVRKGGEKFGIGGFLGDIVGGSED